MPGTPEGHTRDQNLETYRSLGDTELVEAVKSGNRAGLEEIFRRNCSILVATATKITRSRPHAEEIVQEIFVKFWRDPSLYNADRGSLRSFLLVQTHRRSIDMIRSESARSKREERVRTLQSSSKETLEDLVVERLGMQPLKIAMAKLTDDERIAIELAYIHGHTYREVAMILRIPDGTIKSRIRTGLRKIKGTLELSRLGEQDDNN